MPLLDLQCWRVKIDNLQDLEYEIVLGFFKKFSVDLIRQAVANLGDSGDNFAHTDLVELKSKDGGVIGVAVKHYTICSDLVRQVLGYLDLIDNYGYYYVKGGGATFGIVTKGLEVALEVFTSKGESL